VINHGLTSTRRFSQAPGHHRNLQEHKEFCLEFDLRKHERALRPPRVNQNSVFNLILAMQIGFVIVQPLKKYAQEGISYLKWFRPMPICSKDGKLKSEDLSLKCRCYLCRYTDINAA
jgi:hypothetical protein